MTYQQPYPFMTSSMLLAHMNPNRASVGSSVGSDYLDPELRCSSTPSHVMSSWGPTHGLPFLGEHEGIPYTPPMPDYNLSTCEGATPPMPTSVPLKQEPASGYPPSDCSSVFSPKESDYERGPSPSTPLDDMSLPYFPAYYEPWDSQSQLLRFPSMANGCVKLDDVHPYQDLFASCSSEERDVKLPIRSCSTPSDRSALDLDWQAQSNPLQPMRAASPPDETPTKEEIRIPSVYQQGYHPYDTDEEEGAGLTDAVATQQLVRGGDEGDAIYAPDSRYPRAMSSQHRDVRGKKRASTSQATQSKKIKLEPNNPAHKAGRTGFMCDECPDASFKDASGLQNHIKKQHTRPFTCVFGFAGCESTFAAKNEWKRHVASQHLLLNYWLCCQGTCAKISNSNPSSAQVFSGYGAGPPALPNGAIFNRKDLYTQHVRRMHVPPALKKQIKQKKTVQEWEERIQTLQSEAHKLRCDLPNYMVCPAPQCGAQFNGANAWDERMEHVAKHLDKAAAGLEEPIVFGGPGDQTLTLWAARPDVAVVVPSATPSGYAMNNPLRPDKVSRAWVRPVAEPDYDGDEDAEGEEVDE